LEPTLQTMLDLAEKHLPWLLNEFFGFLHGALWQALGTETDITAAKYRWYATLCDKVGARYPDVAQVKGGCYHGIGHGTIFYALAANQGLKYEACKTFNFASVNISYPTLQLAEEGCSALEGYVASTTPCWDGVYHTFFFLSDHAVMAKQHWAYPCNLAINPRGCFLEMMFFGWGQRRWAALGGHDADSFPPLSACVSDIHSEVHRLGCIASTSFYLFPTFDEISTQKGCETSAEKYRCTYEYQFDARVYGPMPTPVHSYFRGIDSDYGSSLVSWCRHAIEDAWGGARNLLWYDETHQARWLKCIEESSYASSVYGHAAPQEWVDNVCTFDVEWFPPELIVASIDMCKKQVRSLELGVLIRSVGGRR